MCSPRRKSLASLRRQGAPWHEQLSTDWGTGTEKLKGIPRRTKAAPATQCYQEWVSDLLVRHSSPLLLPFFLSSHLLPVEVGGGWGWDKLGRSEGTPHGNESRPLLLSWPCMLHPSAVITEKSAAHCPQRVPGQCRRIFSVNPCLAHYFHHSACLSRFSVALTDHMNDKRKDLFSSQFWSLGKPVSRCCVVQESSCCVTV